MKKYMTMGKTIKLESKDLRRMINEAIKRVLREGIIDTLQPRLQRIVKSGKLGGEIMQSNLPDGVRPGDIADEDIQKITTNPSRDDKYNIKLSSGYYVVISPEAECIKRANDNAARKEELRNQRQAEIDATPISKTKEIPFQTPEEHKEQEKMKRAAERGPVFRSMKQVQEYIEDKYGEYLEFLTTRTRRGREYVYQARITYVASSYADGPSHVDDEVVEAVTKYLEPFGFYYAGNREDHDERQWSTNGWHVWKRKGATDPYERYLMRQARHEMEFGY
jgi:hypothetical protein